MPPCARQGQGDHARQRPSGHRRQVAEVHGQGLAAHAAGIVAGQLEVDVVHEHVHGHQALFRAAHAEHGGIVADSQRKAAWLPIRRRR